MVFMQQVSHCAAWCPNTHWPGPMPLPAALTCPAHLAHSCAALDALLRHCSSLKPTRAFFPPCPLVAVAVPYYRAYHRGLLHPCHPRAVESILMKLQSPWEIPRALLQGAQAVGPEWGLETSHAPKVVKYRQAFHKHSTLLLIWKPRLREVTDLS